MYSQKAKLGGLAVLEHEGRYIYYLITKKILYGKPAYVTLWKCLIELKSHIEENKVKNLAMPKIGCGYDRLDWNVMKSMLEYIFQNIDVKIVVCDFQQVCIGVF